MLNFGVGVKQTQEFIKLPIIVVKDTAVHTTITTLEIPARIQFITITPGGRTLRIKTLCRMGGITIPTSTNEKLPTVVKAPKSSRSKDIEPQQVAKKRQQSGHRGN